MELKKRKSMKKYMIKITKLFQINIMITMIKFKIILGKIKLNINEINLILEVCF